MVRLITTVEELEALPIGAVLVDHAENTEPAPWQRDAWQKVDVGTYWVTGTNADYEAKRVMHRGPLELVWPVGEWPPADLVASLRLEWPSIRNALDPALHTPARAVGYLAANGWAEESDRHGGAVWQSAELQRSVFVPMETSFVDWDKRMAELVHDLADAYGTGEIGILIAIANHTEEP